MPERRHQVLPPGTDQRENPNQKCVDSGGDRRLEAEGAGTQEEAQVGFGAGGREVPKVEAGERHHADPLQREGPGAEVEQPQNHRAQEDHGAHQADPQLRHGVPEPGTVRNDDPDRIQEIYTQQVPGRQ